MTTSRSAYRNTCQGIVCTVLLLLCTGARAEGPENLLQQISAYPHATPVEFSEARVLDHEFGLGAIRKVGGAWQFKDSERLSGVLTSYTWQIVDGFTSAEVMADLIDGVQGLPGQELLFSCDGRACGPGVQWANRVFHQRVLYGQENLQRYRVFALGDGTRYRLVIYSAARTADRQYLHAELLRADP